MGKKNRNGYTEEQIREGIRSLRETLSAAQDIAVELGAMVQGDKDWTILIELPNIYDIADAHELSSFSSNVKLYAVKNKKT